jgi:hypothetical protein
MPCPGLDSAFFRPHIGMRGSVMTASRGGASAAVPGGSRPAGFSCARAARALSLPPHQPWPPVRACLSPSLANGCVRCPRMA